MSELYKRLIGVLKFEPNFVKTVLITRASSEGSLARTFAIRKRKYKNERSYQNLSISPNWVTPNTRLKVYFTEDKNVIVFHDMTRFLAMNRTNRLTIKVAI